MVTTSFKFARAANLMRDHKKVRWDCEPRSIFLNHRRPVFKNYDRHESRTELFERQKNKVVWTSVENKLLASTAAVAGTTTMGNWDMDIVKTGNRDIMKIGNNYDGQWGHNEDGEQLRWAMRTSWRQGTSTIGNGDIVKIESNQYGQSEHRKDGEQPR